MAADVTAASGPGRRGPRRQGPEPVAEIKAAALRLFSQSGIEATSIRSIAADARVDPALVRYYFGSKRTLSAAVLERSDDADIAVRFAAQVRSGQAERLMRFVLLSWEDLAERPLMLGRLRRALEGQGEAHCLQALFTALPDAGERPEVDDEVDLTGALIVSSLLGFVVARYLLAIEPLASAPADAIAGWWAAVVRSSQGHPDWDCRVRTQSDPT